MLIIFPTSCPCLPILKQFHSKCELSENTCHIKSLCIPVWETSIDHTIVVKEENHISSKSSCKQKLKTDGFKVEIFVPLIGNIIDFRNRNNICATSKFYTASRGCLASCYFLKAKYITELKKGSRIPSAKKFAVH